MTHILAIVQNRHVTLVHVVHTCILLARLKGTSRKCTEGDWAQNLGCWLSTDYYIYMRQVPVYDFEVYEQSQITVSPGPAEMAVFQWASSCNNMRSALSSNDGRLSWISRRITLMKPARNWMLKSSYHKANLSCKIRTEFFSFYYFVPNTVISLQSAKSSTRDWRDERASLIIKKKINKEQNKAVIPIIKNSANISLFYNK